jgi:hypothetical protein
MLDFAPSEFLKFLNVELVFLAVAGASSVMAVLVGVVGILLTILDDWL